MKPAFDITNYNYPNTCMCCNNLEEAFIFAQHLASRGLHYSSGASYLDFKILVHISENLKRSKLGFYFNKGFIRIIHPLKNKNTIVLRFDKFDWTPYEQKDLHISESDEVAMSDFLHTFNII